MEWTTSVSEPALGHFPFTGSFHTQLHSRGYFFYPSLTNGETEAQSGQVTSLCHLVGEEQGGFDFRCPDFKSCMCMAAHFFISLGVCI